MAWSEEARRAAAEARRRKRKTPYGASRGLYAQELRVARGQLSGLKPGRKRNQAVRRQAKFILSPKLNYGD